MARDSEAYSVPCDFAVRAQPSRHSCGAFLKWSHRKIRIACLVLVGAALPAVAGFAVSVSPVRWLCLAWLTGIAILISSLSKRASTDTVVLSVDQRGVLDRRLMPRHIEWHEIEAIYPVDPNRSHVVDIKLRWPEITLAETRRRVRIGAHCQRSYGVPAITISMLLLEGNVADVLDAVAQYRPDLLRHANQLAVRI
jgi:hypothetical protein